MSPIIMLLVVPLAMASLIPVDLRVENEKEPLGIESLVRFSWRLLDDSYQRGQKQTAYQINVVNSLSNVVMWDSGKVVSKQNHLVHYGGKPLQSSTKYSWSVRVWDSMDSPSQYSPSSSFITGLLTESEWLGSWITGGTSTQLRTEFTLPSGAITTTVLHVSGLGYFDLHLNGHKVGDHFLDVGWTDYPKRSYYVTFDVTDYLIPNQKNALAVTLGNGWFSCMGGQPGCINTPPQLLLQTTVNIANRPPFVVTSNTHWKTSTGPILMNSLYNGETYDARLETTGWTMPNFDDSHWNTTTLATFKPTKLSSQVFPPIRHVSEIHPVSISTIRHLVHVIDFGQNTAGVVRIALRGCSPGTSVVLRHAELLMHPPYGEKTGEIYTGNLRGAKATDTYICKGDPSGVEVYTPTFTQHGFRYCEVYGLTDAPNLADVVLLEMHSDVEQTGSFASVHPLINKIQRGVVWGQKSNLMSVPTDCPQRDERRGWMGDAALTTEEAFFNFDMASLYFHWLNIINDDQNKDGSVPDFVPGLGDDGDGAPNWETAYMTILWASYRYNGDVDVLQKHWVSLQAYVAFWNSVYAKTGLKNFRAGYGDWVPPPPMPSSDGHLVGAFAYLRDLSLYAEIASALGHDDIANSVLKQLVILKEEFNSAFYNPTKKIYGSGLQTEMAMGLWLGAVPEADKTEFLAYLINDIMVTQKIHITTGILGWKFLLEALTSVSHTDIGIALNLQDTYPSLGYSIQGEGNDEPATTIWELWDSNTEGPGMNSRNHIMFGTVGSWFYKALLGIVPLPAKYSTFNNAGGFELFAAGPDSSAVNVYNTTSASGRVMTPFGPIDIDWGIVSSLACSNDPEGSLSILECSMGNIVAIPFVSYGNASGDCEGGFKMGVCNSPNSRKLVEAACLGKPSCSVFVSNDEFGGDPCVGTPKSLAVTVTCPLSAPIFALSIRIPVGTTALVNVPLVPSLGQTLNNFVISEGSVPLWKDGKFISGAVQGVLSGSIDEAGLNVQLVVVSGDYNFAGFGQ